MMMLNIFFLIKLVILWQDFFFVGFQIIFNLFNEIFT